MPRRLFHTKNHALPCSMAVLSGISVLFYVWIYHSVALMGTDISDETFQMPFLDSKERSTNKKVLHTAPRSIHVLNSTTFGQAKASIRWNNRTVYYRKVKRLGHALPYSYSNEDDSLSEAPSEHCEPLADWQTDIHPSCLAFHEMDLIQSHVEFINWGAYRTVFRVDEFDGSVMALKMLNHDADFDRRVFEKHRRDAVAFQVLSASPGIPNIYGYCVNSAIFDFATEGDLRSRVESEELKETSLDERFEIARDAAAALADFHHVDKKTGLATMMHGDVKDNQFLLLDGRYQLNDFNKATFLSWNPRTNQSCGVQALSCPGKWRSPEEYHLGMLSDKTDVWSFGLVLYCILVGDQPYEGLRSRHVKRLVKAGGRAEVTDTRILKSNHTFHKSMLKAMDMCLVHDPAKRATSQQVADFLDSAFQSTKTKRLKKNIFQVHVAMKNGSSR
jgi:hypothetical protein